MENLQFTGTMNQQLMTKVRAIRGAITVEVNTKEAMREAVMELLTDIESRNQLDYENVVSVIFTVTTDLDAIFPAAIARERPQWTNIPLLDIQQMQVKGSLAKCIRVLIYINTVKSQSEMYHSYLRKAEKLRPDLSLTHAFLSNE
ncbi:MAG: chorismate mutase [Cyanobacteria bacterium]|nr:chorismate mutase [Cyanobacteria bacterium CG_2015-16_32_12]NCO76708.1 chorismate mutase [Cyanobacteria bacterium CG_2015-22_32_23]NCQ04776.1 chorismate mutase [Cyanobacteria bacterium CG_2015-09_32_10]NCQ41148.1 chorismate mutase [Cyanobacteria bacterium CG_2015-04_32_10]NCS84706.1 chorismate mutase [Cyanobacteria bacterium CG_2015-02_32_10]